jgi:hypothetical protein
MVSISTIRWKRPRADVSSNSTQLDDDRRRSPGSGFARRATLELVVNPNGRVACNVVFDSHVAIFPALKHWVQGRAAPAFDPMLYRQRHAAERGINQLTGPLPQQRLWARATILIASVRLLSSATGRS